MASRGQIRLKKIWAILDACAPGYTRKERTHNWAVTWKGKTYSRLPRGKHGKRESPPIEIGHIKQMIRYLEIDWDCATSQLPQL